MTWISRDQTQLPTTSMQPQNTSKSSWGPLIRKISPVLQPRPKIANRTNQSTLGCPHCAHFTFSYLGPLTRLAFGVPTAMMANAPTPSPWIASLHNGILRPMAFLLAISFDESLSVEISLCQSSEAHLRKARSLWNRHSNFPEINAFFSCTYFQWTLLLPPDSNSHHLCCLLQSAFL